MAFLEKSNWITLIISVPTLLIYLAVVVPQVLSRPIGEVAWATDAPARSRASSWPTPGNVVAAPQPRERTRAMTHREIDRLGERVGSWLIIAGALIASAGHGHRRPLLDRSPHLPRGLSGAFLASAAKGRGPYRGSFQRW